MTISVFYVCIFVALNIVINAILRTISIPSGHDSMCESLTNAFSAWQQKLKVELNNEVPVSVAEHGVLVPVVEGEDSIRAVSGECEPVRRGASAAGEVGSPVLASKTAGTERERPSRTACPRSSDNMDDTAHRVRPVESA